MKTEKKALTQSELNQFQGDLERYRHSLNRHVIFTPGVLFLAERAGAHWLIDAIASYLTRSTLEPLGKRDPRIRSLHFWNLDVWADKSATLYAEADLNEKPFIKQEIPFTDFPLRHVSVWAGFDGEYWTLYLPSEH